MEAELKVKREVSVFMKRRIGFAKKASEETVHDDTASLDEHPAVTSGESNDDPGGGATNHNTSEDMEASQDANLPAGQMLACDEEELDMTHCDDIIRVND